jgi:hypothetical protein
MQEVFLSNLGWDTGYLDRSFSCFLLVHPGKYWNRTSIRPRQLPSKSLPIHLSSYNPMPYNLDAVASLNSSWEKKINTAHEISDLVKKTNLSIYPFFLED